MAPPRSGRASCALRIGLVVVVLLAAGATAAHGQSQFIEEARHILVLHSYHAGYPWTDEIQRAIVATLGQRSDDDRRIRLLVSDRDCATLELIYRDNIPANLDIHERCREEELGTLLIRELTEHQLGGTISLSVSPEGGTECLIHISRNVYKDRVPHDNPDR